MEACARHHDIDKTPQAVTLRCRVTHLDWLGELLIIFIVSPVLHLARHDNNDRWLRDLQAAVKGDKRQKCRDTTCQ
jgi:hypothetical protein